jgi:hypothetical protein
MLDDDGTKDDILLEITLARDDFPDVHSNGRVENVRENTSGQTKL